ncbi:relaxase/mobilization nuclease domain-containing protein [Kaistella yonginensis]|uniref:relaxase/mobilization nuclease domain-containing protein n=1 Tax=Kaistella yonginensis TaxID=658267 RepID=UPI0025B5AAE9|nr:relaxase/mobilization nuclease domain-containing protein [Kaistella yonginensis]MDN3606759.1 relaxase/mobilization nuclease domain-containing protein [Kaistella yonginensis]
MNNSATTRLISKIALEYNGNDKGMAELAAVNFLLSSNSEDQFHEMKIVADRNHKVKKWALTGYISPPEEIGKSLSNEELSDIAIEALRKVGVTDLNQFRLDIHNSTKQKHIHFVVNRMNIHGKCTVKSHRIGERFGEAVRQICQERNLKTDVEIGIEKKAEMLKNLTESLRTSNNFEELISKMRAKGFDVQLSSNVKDGISGMRIILEKDKNPNTERQYKAGYTLSQISNKLKISEVKMAFEIKQSFKKNLNIARSLNDLQIKMHQDGFKMRFQYKGEFKPNQSNEVQDVWINKIYHNIQNQPKDGFFYKKFDGFSLSAIDSNYSDLIGANSRNKTITSGSKKAEDSILEVAEELIEDILKPTYVAQQEDDWWKKKRKGRR